ncbi:MAG: SpoIIE family protein phosphatase [Bacteroidales bacterium]
MEVVNSPNNETLTLIEDQWMNDHFASLRYAGMIQNALLPDDELLKDVVRDYFIMFLPRDIVSGDFYYAFQNRRYVCIAAGDCTGHGVPGALMSIMGINFLNEVFQTKAELKANRVLNLMREKVMKALHQTGNQEETKDSIDIGLCILERETGILQFSGANRPLIMMRDGVMTEYKPNKMTIGVAAFTEQPFTQVSIDLLPGDTFYLFSDGFYDQFGEITDKKFKYKQFRHIIQSVTGLSMASQKECLEYSFTEWKGSAPQVDDVLVFGFQF